MSEFKHRWLLLWSQDQKLSTSSLVRLQGRECSPTCQANSRGYSACLQQLLAFLALAVSWWMRLSPALAAPAKAAWAVPWPWDWPKQAFATWNVLWDEWVHLAPSSILGCATVGLFALSASSEAASTCCSPRDSHVLSKQMAQVQKPFLLAGTAWEPHLPVYLWVASAGSTGRVEKPLMSNVWYIGFHVDIYIFIYLSI